MSETTHMTWRFRLGERVRWRDEEQLGTILARRWVERPAMPPFAEYQITRPFALARPGWVLDGELVAAEENS